MSINGFCYSLIDPTAMQVALHVQEGKGTLGTLTTPDGQTHTILFSKTPISIRQKTVPGCLRFPDSVSSVSSLIHIRACAS